MMPRIGVTDVMSSTLESESAPSVAIPTPMSAVRIGSPAATSVPSRAKRTIAAITRPASSFGPTTDGTSDAMVWEKPAETPSTGASSKAAISASFVGCVTAICGSVNDTMAIAALPSLETSRMPDARSSSVAPASSFFVAVASFAGAASSSACFSRMVFRPPRIRACFSLMVARPAVILAWFVAIVARPASSWAWPDASCALPASSLAWLVRELRLAGVELPLLRGERGPAGVELGLLGLDLRHARVDLRLRGGELVLVLVVGAVLLRLRDGGVELGLLGDQLGLAGVELRLAGRELLLRRVELRLAGRELLLARVELRLARGELRAAGVDLRLRGRQLGLRRVELRLAAHELLLRRVELDLTGGELGLGAVDLALAAGDLGARLGELRLPGGDLRGLVLTLGLRGEGVEDALYAADLRGLCDAVGDGRLLGGADRRAVLGAEDDRAGAAGGLWEGGLQPLRHLRGRGAGDRDLAGGRAAGDHVRAGGGGEDRQPHEDDGPPSPGREAADPVEQFCHGARLQFRGDDRSRARRTRSGATVSPAGDCGTAGRRGSGPVRQTGQGPSSARSSPARSSVKLSWMKCSGPCSPGEEVGANWKAVAVAVIAADVTRWG